MTSVTEKWLPSCRLNLYLVEREASIFIKVLIFFSLLRTIFLSLYFFVISRSSRNESVCKVSSDRKTKWKLSSLSSWRWRKLQSYFESGVTSWSIYFCIYFLIILRFRFLIRYVLIVELKFMNIFLPCIWFNTLNFRFWQKSYYLSRIQYMSIIQNFLLHF